MKLVLISHFLTNISTLKEHSTKVLTADFTLDRQLTVLAFALRAEIAAGAETLGCLAVQVAATGRKSNRNEAEIWPVLSMCYQNNSASSCFKHLCEKLDA